MVAICAWVCCGWLKARDPRAGLKENIKAFLGTSCKPALTVAHHDAVIARELDFLKAGIDPNHGDLGRFVNKYKHRLWHKRGNGYNNGGGPFNAVWNDFFIQNPNATAAQIRQQIQDVQNGTIKVLMADGTYMDFRYP